LLPEEILTGEYQRALIKKGKNLNIFLQSYVKKSGESQAEEMSIKETHLLGDIAHAKEIEQAQQKAVCE
jgi:hypothetical protein